MRKMHFVSFVAILLVLCMALTACGQKTTQQPKADEGPSAVSSEQSDYGGDTYDDDPVEIINEGDFRHEIGDCAFYTENNLDSWINDGVFDFYGMMNYFGLTDRLEGLSEEDGYSAGKLSGWHAWVNLKYGDSVWVYSTFVVELDGGKMLFVTYNNGGDIHNYETVRTPNKSYVSYELAEVLLYVMECVDEDSYAVVEDVNLLGLPDYFEIATN